MKKVKNTAGNTASRYRGLKPPWKKGVKQKPGPGRPRTREFAKFVRQVYEENPNPARMARLIRQMEKRCPQELAHYLAGKPVERVQHSGNLTVVDEFIKRAREKRASK